MCIMQQRGDRPGGSQEAMDEKKNVGPLVVSVKIQNNRIRTSGDLKICLVSDLLVMFIRMIHMIQKQSWPKR